MKKRLLFAFLALAMAISQMHGQEKTTWDFTAGLSDETIANLIADETNWSSNGENNWKNNLKQPADEEWKANGEVIEELRGLKIDIGSHAGNSIHLATTKMRLTRPGTVITFPKLNNGQKIIIIGTSANVKSTDRGIAPVQNYIKFQPNESSPQTNGQCIFLGSGVEGSVGVYTFVWKVETEETDPVDVQFTLNTGGIDFTSFRIAEDSTTPEGISVGPANPVIAVGENLEMKGSFVGGDFTGEWLSDNPAVATVSDKGVVTGVSAGTANITFQWAEDQSLDIYKATATVTVNDHPSGTTITPDLTGVVVGNTVTLTGKFAGGKFAGEWTSDNPEVATVTNEGVVTGVSVGTANITYQWADDQSQETYKATAAITVVNAFDSDDCIEINKYDFTKMGAVTLAIQDTPSGKIYNAGNNTNNDVYFCTNEGLENLAVQAVYNESDNKGWTIRDSYGLYEGSSAGRCAAIGGIKKGWYVVFNYSGTDFYTKSDGSDNGIRKIEVGGSNYSYNDNYRAYYALEDGMIGFELNKGYYLRSIYIYKALSDITTFTANTVEGIEVTYAVLDDESTNCQVGLNKRAINYDASGAITIPSTVIYNDIEYHVTHISDEAFYDCYNLTSVTIPEGVSSIGEYAFQYCSGLTSVSLPSSLTIFDWTAFYQCTDLEKISVAEGNAVFDSRNDCNAVIRTSTNELVFGTKKTIIPGSVTSIGNFAFYECFDLTTITIPEGVTSIGNYAFNGCAYLTAITIPEGVVTIGNYAFERCSRLTTITIPEGVETIGNYAFNNCNRLMNITLPESVTSIGGAAFRYCPLLEAIAIPTGVTQISGSTFNDCSALKSVILPTNLNTIGYGAFYNCPNLENITIPAEVQSIGSDAFYGCIKLNKIIVESETPASIYSSTFNNKSNIVLYVPMGSAADYQAATNWDGFKRYVEYGDGATATLTIGSTGQGTYCSDIDLDFSGIDDVKAYVATAFVKKTGNIVMTRLTDIPGGTGIYVKGTPGTYNIPYSKTTTSCVNMLKGNVEAVSVNPREGIYVNYYLSNGSSGVGFYRVSNTRTMSANRAILQVPLSLIDEADAASRTINMVFDDETTGIEDAVLTNGGRANTEDFYNLNGQRINTPKRGLYIKNGKKINVK